MKLILRLVVATLAVLIGAYVVPGVWVESITVAVVVAVVLGVLNLFIKPVLKIIAFPINFLTLGLFNLVINTVLILATDYLVAGFRIDSLLSAFLFGLIVSAIDSFLTSLLD